MAPRLYKYAGPKLLALAFDTPGECRLKCSSPKDFNDPYELFLSIDPNQDPATLAFYRELIGDLPQLPTTCFSRSPAVVPMWAHYAQNHRGLVIEFDEACILEALPNTALGDVAPSLATDLQHAQLTLKPRHAYFAQRAVFSAAYYTKHSCWRYEEERRLLAKHQDLVPGTELLLFPVPTRCISAIIVGHRASGDTRTSSLALAIQLRTRWFEMRIGRSTLQPYFVGPDGSLHVFVDRDIVAAANACRHCGEPIADDAETCPWCAIQEDDEFRVARSNPMRILADAGLLEEYYRRMAEIRRITEGE